MSISINMDSKLYKFHNFNKTSLVTERGNFDYYTCADCGLKGKRYGISENIVLVRPSKKKMAQCDGTKGTFNIETYEQKMRGKPTLIGKQVKVIMDTHLFSFDAKNGDMYEVIETPKGEDKSASGVWVQGKKCTFRMLPGEYEYVTH